MDIKELEKVMIEKGAIIRAIPMVETGLVEVRHASQFENKPEYSTYVKYEEDFKRDMLHLERKLQLGGKFLLAFQKNQLIRTNFNGQLVFDHLEDVIKYLIEE